MNTAVINLDVVYHFIGLQYFRIVTPPLPSHISLHNCGGLGNIALK